MSELFSFRREAGNETKNQNISAAASRAVPKLPENLKSFMFVRLFRNDRSKNLVTQVLRMSDAKKSKLDIFAELKESRSKAAKNVSEFKFNEKRVRNLLEGSGSVEKGVVYWMSRDQRVQDNWAFLYAQKLALENKVPLQVRFTFDLQNAGLGL